MVARGIVPEGAPIELLDGLLVWKDRAARGEAAMSVGPGHQLAVDKLQRLASRFPRHGCCLRRQAPIRVLPNQEPEPDAAVLQGRPEHYRTRHPEPKDVCLVIEIADSSLERDRTTKLRIYARASIPHYIIVNLVDGQLEVFSTPDADEGRYLERVIRKRGERIGLRAGKGREVRVPVGALLP
ncbi:MAG: Uma2 family endonuclease [Planctomycetes bacterium]|nr:Uma2 family endonuclease [Planctomycetota bacterium]